MRYLIELCVVVLIGYYFYTMVGQYMASTKSTVKERIIEAGNGSMTIFIQRISQIVVGVFALVPDVAAVFGADGVQEAVRGILPTGAVPYYIIGLNILTELARRRTLPQSAS
jgi:hypothetical protein